MLIPCCRLKTTVSGKPPEEIIEAVNPEAIDRVRYVDDGVSELQINDEWVRVRGNIEFWLKAANASRTAEA